MESLVEKIKGIELTEGEDLEIHVDTEDLNVGVDKVWYSLMVKVLTLNQQTL